MRAAVVLLLSALAWPVHGIERIISYHSDITVHENGSQLVVETIRVHAEGKNIKRGIYRDFPTEYTTHTGGKVRVDFRIAKVERDGKPEPFHTKRLSNGIRVYAGSSDVFLEPGEYTYTLTYTTDRQLTFREEFDELYWNVTGNGWMFGIERASARVRLPPGISSSDIRTYGYTGPQGAEGQGYRASVVDGGAEFFTTERLGPQEGLTLSVSWPKGFIREPTWQDRLEWQWRDNPGLFVVWIGAFVLLVYYLLAWRLVGVDPKPGVLMPEYGPPEGYPPAALRMVRRMGWDDKALSAALVGLAVKGALKISEDDDVFGVTPTGKEVDNLAPGESAILYAIGGSTLTFKSSNHARVKALRDAHRESLEGQYQRRYFYSNKGFAMAGWALTFACVGYAGFQIAKDYGEVMFLFPFFTVFIVMFGAPFFQALWRMRYPHARNFKGWLQLFAAGVPLLFIVFVFGAGGFGDVTGVVPWGLIAGFLLIAAINVAFYYLLKAPTARGRKLLDHVEGFRDYLRLAESDELRFKYAKPVTPELFEAFLPYAIALDVETEWAERFASELRKQGKEPSAYSTHWYSGHSFSGVRGLSSSVGGALASTVSSASTPPGSSSGGSFSGGGGGFSGGGGGGGGGGGW